MNDSSFYVLGVDGGGTNTTGLLSDGNGKILAQYSVGATNPNSVGFDIVRNEYQRLLDNLKIQDKKAFENLKAVFIGMAGIGRPEDKRKIRGLISDFFAADTKILIDHDAINALYSGTLGEPGIVNIAGTGSITFGIDEYGERGRVGGWGYLLGDPGSGFAIGREALQAIFHAYDGSGPPTQLTNDILQYFDRNAPPELLSKIYGIGKAREVIAPISKLVVEAADCGDEVAIQIIGHAGNETAQAIKHLSNQLLLHDKNQKVRVTLTGGVYQRSDWFLPVIQERLNEDYRHCFSFIIPEVSPVMGALVGALKGVGGKVDPSFLANVKEGCSN